MGFILVYVTFPDEEIANSISQKLLKLNVVAGANIFPVKSQFWWMGKIQSETEQVAIYQAAANNWEIIVKHISSVHPYEVPCIIKIDAEANDSYQEWVKENSSYDTKK